MIYLSFAKVKIKRVLNSNPHEAKIKKSLYLFLPNPINLALGKNVFAERNFDFVELSKLLHEISKDIMKPFLDFLEVLSRKHASDLWWGNRIYEPNTLINFLFLNCCYLKITDSIAKENHEVMLIVVRHRLLLHSIEQNCKSIGKECVKLSSSGIGLTFVRLARLRKIIGDRCKKILEESFTLVSDQSLASFLPET